MGQEKTKEEFVQVKWNGTTDHDPRILLQRTQKSEMKEGIDQAPITATGVLLRLNKRGGNEMYLNMLIINTKIMLITTLMTKQVVASLCT